MLPDHLFARGRAIQLLNQRWKAHQTQLMVLRKVIRDKAPVVFTECGRKWGKTEIAAYLEWRAASVMPMAGCYYFAPFQTQGKEIVWAPGRLQHFGPRELLDGNPNNTEMRINLINESFIKVDGSDNFERHRGTQPHFAVYDEFKDFRREFHQAMGPNYAVFQAQLAIFGTPPEELELEHYDALRDQAKAEGCYFNFPTWANPHIDRDWLRRERNLLYARGEGDVWEREYAAKRVHGGSNAIFPMFDPAANGRHIKPHQQVMDSLFRDRHKLIWQTIADPGTATVFAVIFRAINPYTKQVWRLDEIYEREQANTSTSRMIPRIRAKQAELFPDAERFGVQWHQIYDEAATWFAAEAQASFNDSWTPSHKLKGDGQSKKEHGLSLIKDQMLTARFIASDRCVHFKKEILGYIRKDGKIPKENDHLIDADRYGNAMEGLDLTFEFEAPPPDRDDMRRFATPEDDFESDPAEFDADDY